MQQNVEWAQQQGLSRLACVDHVRANSRWVQEFVAAVRTTSRLTSLKLLACVEAKILDASGTLDLPQDLSGIDYIYAADHKFPMDAGCCSPRELQELMAQKTLDPQAVIEGFVRTLQRVMHRYPNLVIAHLFSILPKLKLNEALVPHHLLQELAVTAKQTGTIIEVDERWSCPSERTLLHFMQLGVKIVASSDAHCREKIGQYQYVENVALALGLHQ